MLGQLFLFTFLNHHIGPYINMILKITILSIIIMPTGYKTVNNNNNELAGLVVRISPYI